MDLHTIFLPYWIFAVSHDPEELGITLYTLGRSPNGYKTKLFSLGSLTEVFQLAERLGKIPIEVKDGHVKLDPKFEKLVFETSWKMAMDANCPK